MIFQITGYNTAGEILTQTWNDGTASAELTLGAWLRRLEHEPDVHHIVVHRHPEQDKTRLPR